MWAYILIAVIAVLEIILFVVIKKKPDEIGVINMFTDISEGGAETHLFLELYSKDALKDGEYVLLKVKDISQKKQIV